MFHSHKSRSQAICQDILYTHLPLCTENTVQSSCSTPSHYDSKQPSFHTVGLPPHPLHHTIRNDCFVTHIGPISTDPYSRRNSVYSTPYSSHMSTFRTVRPVSPAQDTFLHTCLLPASDSLQPPACSPPSHNECSTLSRSTFEYRISDFHNVHVKCGKHLSNRRIASRHSQIVYPTPCLFTCKEHQ